MNPFSFNKRNNYIGPLMLIFTQEKINIIQKISNITQETNNITQGISNITQETNNITQGKN